MIWSLLPEIGRYSKLVRDLDTYYIRADRLGYSRADAEAILDEEMSKARESLSFSSAAALKAAARRLATASVNTI